MIRRLINRLQGKVWRANCGRCRWTAGRNDLTEKQAENRAQLHANAHIFDYGLAAWPRARMITVSYWHILL